MKQKHRLNNEIQSSEGRRLDQRILLKRVTALFFNILSWKDGLFIITGKIKKFSPVLSGKKKNNNNKKWR